MRLINADKLNDILINISEHLQQEGTVVSGPMHKFYEHFIEIVKAQLTVDAKEVVQCKDCKHNVNVIIRGENCQFCGLDGGLGGDTKDDYFCFHGQKKGE